jgi:hypothetical protein
VSAAFWTSFVKSTSCLAQKRWISLQFMRRPLIKSQRNVVKSRETLEAADEVGFEGGANYDREDLIPLFLGKIVVPE